MSMKLLVIPAALGVMGLINVAAAAPGVGHAAATLKPEAAQAVEQVTWKRCWSNGYYTHCWRPAPRVYSFYVRPRPHYGYYAWPRPHVYGFYGWGHRRW